MYSSYMCSELLITILYSCNYARDRDVYNMMLCIYTTRLMLFVDIRYVSAYSELYV